MVSGLPTKGFFGFWRLLVMWVCLPASLLLLLLTCVCVCVWREGGGEWCFFIYLIRNQLISLHRIWFLSNRQKGLHSILSEVYIFFFFFKMRGPQHDNSLAQRYACRSIFSTSTVCYMSRILWFSFLKPSLNCPVRKKRRLLSGCVVCLPSLRLQCHFGIYFNNETLPCFICSAELVCRYSLDSLLEK